MTTHEAWPALHDATLESLELRWSTGEAILQIRTGDATCPRSTLVASEVRRLSCDRHMPWGTSISINEVRGPGVDGDAAALEIEMQSGDLIRIEARSFSLRSRAGQ